MPVERPGAFDFVGRPVTLVGPEIREGQVAPGFTATGTDLNPVSLEDFAGKVKLIAAVPSLDTGVCSKETRTFNERAAELGEDVVILTLSMDLPFAQKRWCGAEGVERVITLSDHRDASFGEAYGVLIKELRLLSRAVFVLDRENRVRHVEYVPRAVEEPDYDRALAAARAAIR